MTNLDKEGFLKIYNDKKYKKKKLIFSCYQDLFIQEKSSSDIRDIIEHETGILVNHSLIFKIRSSKSKLTSIYKPLWREVVPDVQKGNNKEIFIPKPLISSVGENLENKSSGPPKMNKVLPSDYVRKPHNFKEKRYHESLKNYTFDYPWFELDEDGIPRPAMVGKSPDDRLQWIIDIKTYDKIKESYIMPDELKEFRTKHPSVFGGFLKDGFPYNRGGYHPNEEILNS